METLDSSVVKEITFHIDKRITFDRIIKYLNLAFTRLPNQKDGFIHYSGEDHSLALANPSVKCVELYNINQNKVDRVIRLINKYTYRTNKSKKE